MNAGVIYRLTPHPGDKWTEEILYNFSGSNGIVPSGPLTLDTNGNVYGVTAGGGSYEEGTAFRLANTSGSWNLTTLHSFGAPPDGKNPSAGLTFGPDGNLFGVTGGGGRDGFGTAFELSPNGDAVYYAKIHDFGKDSDGVVPLSGLVPYKDRLVGTTLGGGGSANAGTIFTLGKSATGKWEERVVYSFGQNANDFGGPSTAQGFASDHHGAFIGCGTGAGSIPAGVFAVTPSGTDGTPWTESVLYTFGQKPSEPKYFCDLVQGPSGVLYGTSPYGGDVPHSAGVVFTLSPPSGGNANWTETTLFNLSPGAFLGYKPIGAPVRHNRVFYGVSTQSRGGSGLDFVFVAP